MIPLVRKRDASAFPRDFLGAKLQEKHVDLVDRYYKGVETGAKISFASGKWKSAKVKVRADSGKKCAYCEASTSVVAHGDVEHFRPKALYWWLAYDFDNYLFACQICNQIYKSDNFPVTPANLRLAAPAMPAQRPGTPAAMAALAHTLAIDASLATDDSVRQRWLAEDADLVNPYLEDPLTIFVFEVDDSNGEVWLRPGSDPKSQRAYSASVDFLGLNREELRKDRYDHYRMLAMIKLVSNETSLSAATKREIAKDLRRLVNVKTPFAGMSRYFLRKWALLPQA